MIIRRESVAEYRARIAREKAAAIKEANTAENKLLFGRTLKAVRQPMRQLMLANEVNVSRTLVVKWETGAKFPTPEYFNKICVALSLQPEEREQLLKAWLTSFRALPRHARSFICNKYGISRELENVSDEEILKLF